MVDKIDEVLNWLDDEHGGDTDAATAFGVICDLRDTCFVLVEALQELAAAWPADSLPPHATALKVANAINRAKG